MFGIGSRPDVHTPAESPGSSPDWLDIRARATKEAAKPAGSRKRDEEKVSKTAEGTAIEAARTYLTHSSSGA